MIDEVCRFNIQQTPDTQRACFQIGRCSFQICITQECAMQTRIGMTGQFELGEGKENAARADVTLVDVHLPETFH